MSDSVSQSSDKILPHGEKLDRIRHSVSHVIARRLPGSIHEPKLPSGTPSKTVFTTISPSPKAPAASPFTAEYLPRIEAEMKAIIDSR
ncbi:MAG: hypothetical protein LBK73_01570 [Treponema sp.]|jgi:threonyl-tRNA synthetase|nr:hypothetical protein [Treponema sp.]